MTRLSIIIPMYNAEPYIRKCLESCLDQDLPPEDFEVIVVNDGSTDAGLSVAEGLAAAARSEGKAAVRLFSQENAGQGAARNRALAVAAGEYVWFVDADDWIEPQCLGTLLALAHGFDILAFGAVNYVASEGKLQVHDVFEYAENRDSTGREHFIRLNERIKVCPPFHLFRRQFLQEHSLAFPEGIFHEDAQFIPEALLLAVSVRITTGVYYGRLIHVESTTQSVKPERIRNLHAVVRNLQRFKMLHCPDAVLTRALDSYIANIFNQSNKLTLEFARCAPALQGARLRTGRCAVVHTRALRLFQEQNAAAAGMPWLPGVYCNSLQLKYRVEGFLLKCFPKQMVRIYRTLLFFKDGPFHGPATPRVKGICSSKAMEKT